VWESISELLETYRVGDITGLLGIVISVAGFFVTIRNVTRTKHAAEMAEKAAKNAEESIRYIDGIVSFQEAILIVEEIKRIHREKNWSVIPDRCAAARKILIQIKSLMVDLGETERVTIQEAITNLGSLERASVRQMAETADPATSEKFSIKLMNDVDKLVDLLTSLKKAKTGA
jgi:hypothetical protein